jgi:hypothetical protein
MATNTENTLVLINMTVMYNTTGEMNHCTQHTHDVNHDTNNNTIAAN